MPGAGRRRSRFLRIVAALAVLCVGVWLVGAYRVIQHPRVDPVMAADAVVVLGQPDASSMQRAQQLLDDGVSQRLVLIIPFGPPPQCTNPPSGVTVYCVVPQPQTTRGDARAIRRLAATHHWTRLVVVTWSSHVSRSRMLIHRCFGGTLAVTSYPPGMNTLDWAHEYLYQTGAYLKALLTPTC